MDPISSSNASSQSSVQERHQQQLLRDDGIPVRTSLFGSTSQQAGNIFGSSSSTSLQQQAISMNVSRVGGSSSGGGSNSNGTLFRPPPLSFAQHQDQRHPYPQPHFHTSTHAHTNTEHPQPHPHPHPHPMRLDQAYHQLGHNFPSEGSGSFHPFEEDGDEDRQSDDGSEVDPSFSDIEFWLQRCSICFDARLDFCLEFCRDQFCRDCFQRYVKEVVGNSWGLNITKIKCPVCQDTIPLSEWTKYVDRATLAQYNQYNQPYRSFSRFCGECEQEVVVSEIKRKIIGLPVQDLLPFFDGFLEDLKSLMELGGLTLDKPSSNSSALPSKAPSSRSTRTVKHGPELSERDTFARKVIQRFVEDYRSFCGVAFGQQVRLPSIAQSYLSNLTLRTLGASLSPSMPPSSTSNQTASIPSQQHAAGSSGSRFQASQVDPHQVVDSTNRLPSAQFQRKPIPGPATGVLEVYKTLMMSLLELFDLNQQDQGIPMEGILRVEDNIDLDIDVDMIPASDVQVTSEWTKGTMHSAPSGSKAHCSRPRMMTRAESKRLTLVKKALVRLSKDISSIETRPEQWKELQFLHVRWLRWDWCSACDQELCLQCGVSSHHERQDCFAYMRSLIAKEVEMPVSRRKRPNRANGSATSGTRGSKGKDRKDLDANTIQWKLSNTNPCPNCCILIHRDDGCNKVDCMLCGYRFCWICREAWGVGCGFFKCGRQPLEAIASDDGHPDRADDGLDETASLDELEGGTGDGHVQSLAVADDTSARGNHSQVDTGSSQAGRRRRRSEDTNLEASEKPEIGVPNVFVIQAKRSRA